MSIISRYIFRETFAAWLTVTLVLFVILMSNQFAEVLDDAAAGRLPKDAVFAILSLTSLRYITLLTHLGLFLVALAGLQPPLVARRVVPLLLVAMSGLGVAFAFYLTVLEVFVIHAICYWCVGSAVIILLVLAASLLDLRRTPALESESVAPHPS